MDINNKYCRQITGRDVVTGKSHTINVDVYRVLDAFDVRLAALQHLAKKALCAGLRGHKDQKQDLLDIKQSIEQALDQLQEKDDQAADFHPHQEKDDQAADVHPHHHEIHVNRPGKIAQENCCSHGHSYDLGICKECWREVHGDLPSQVCDNCKIRTARPGELSCGECSY